MTTKEKLMHKGQEVVSYTYAGEDFMLGKSFGTDTPLPKRVHPEFVATIKLKDGSVVKAPREIRKMIWTWWVIQRRSELLDHALVQVAKSMRR